jgi:hypothetical protein
LASVRGPRGEVRVNSEKRWLKVDSRNKKACDRGRLRS